MTIKDIKRFEIYLLSLNFCISKRNKSLIVRGD